MAADPLTRSTVDDLFNGDVSDLEDDPFADNPLLKEIRDDKSVLSPRSALKRKANDDDKENDGLGIEEEVKIVKKRKPIAKLDEERLLSEPGIPKLRALVRSKELAKKLRFKGKGHEFTDAARLLNHFQLWLDNLYPRAKFADGLQLIEKAGHTKRMHITRLEWINEGRPGYRRYDEVQEDNQPQNDPDLFGPAPVQANTPVSSEPNASARPSKSLFGGGLDDDALFIPDANRPSHLHEDDEPGEDELEALLAAQDESINTRQAARQERQMEDSEGEDDLDALLAEQDAQIRPTTKPNPIQQPIQHEDDELDALLAEHEAGQGKPSDSLPSSTKTPVVETHVPTLDSDDEEDDLEALLALQRARSKPVSKDQEPSLPTPQHTSSPTKQIPSSPNAAAATLQGSDDEPTLPGLVPAFSSSPVPNNPEEVDLDDLDALLASQEAKEDAARASAKRSEQTAATPRTDMELNDELFSSSPVPNEESQ